MDMPEVHAPEVRRYNMSRIRSKDTKLEMLVRKYLFSRGLRFYKNDKRYPGHPDIVLPKYNTIVFINGCFWHCHEGCKGFKTPEANPKYWIPKLARTRERDAANIQSLQSSGWNIVIVWECEIKKAVRQKRLERLYEQIVKGGGEDG
jgi:DNA mismatch endonuclease (patch repair protein)